VDAIVLSNHGGRQLDRAPVPFHLLPDVVREVGNDVEVMIDTGIMNGADIVASIALGAKFTLVGRAYLYGLMAGGREGVDRMIESSPSRSSARCSCSRSPRWTSWSPSTSRSSPASPSGGRATCTEVGSTPHPVDPSAAASRSRRVRCATGSGPPRRRPARGVEVFRREVRTRPGGPVPRTAPPRRTATPTHDVMHDGEVVGSRVRGSLSSRRSEASRRRADSGAGTLLYLKTTP
jgi:hypothetical protein